MLVSASMKAEFGEVVRKEGAPKVFSGEVMMVDIFGAVCAHVKWWPSHERDEPDEILIPIENIAMVRIYGKHSGPPVQNDDGILGDPEESDDDRRRE